MNDLEAATLVAESMTAAYQHALALLGCPEDPPSFDGDPTNWAAQGLALRLAKSLAVLNEIAKFPPPLENKSSALNQLAYLKDIAAQALLGVLPADEPEREQTQ